MNKQLLGVIFRILVFVLIGGGFVLFMDYMEIRTAHMGQDWQMFYFFIVPFTAGLTAIMCLLQLHYYRHPERNEHE